MEDFVLSNHMTHPVLGLGTYKLIPGDETYQSVLMALKNGARHIDTSIIYKNEKDVGRAIKDSKIPRHQIFITAKLPPHIKNGKSARRFFERSLKNLGVDYIDAYIINAPGPFDDLDGDYDSGNVEVYKALETIYKEERVGAIGVSQFNINHLKNIMDHCEITPHINQISFFVGHTQDDIVAFCQKHGIFIQAFSPLAKGYVLDNEVVQAMAIKYQQQPAQIVLKYIIQKGHAPIPKAKDPNHIKLNYNLDFKISNEDVLFLDKVDDDPRRYDD